MKRFLFVLFIGLMASSVSSAQENLGKTLPDVKIKKLNGEQVSILDYAQNGKVTVISFWATWCTPCKKELNNILEVYEYWQEDYDAEVLAISLDNAQNMSKVKSYVEGVRWPYKVFIDLNEDLKRSLNFQTIPYTILLDKEGKIVYTHNGYQEGDEYVLEEHIKEYSEKK
jgi:thiol-disulfide isomerase/thioredoxin